MKHLARSHHFILMGGCLLAFMAAVTNVAFLLQTGISVSHLTGDIARLATDLARSRIEIAGDLHKVGSAAVGFLCGAVLSGYFIHHPTLEINRPYGRTTMFIGVLLLAAHSLLATCDWLAIGLAALACGIQNSIASRFRGLILRTTHLTGLFTDLGVSIGMKLKGHDIPYWKIIVPASIAICFFSGALLGTYGAVILDVRLLLVTGLSYVCGGIVWSFLKRTGFFMSSAVGNKSADGDGED
jgi:uncharacterized membrane protein YoaK (UPF0700 family)